MRERMVADVRRHVTQAQMTGARKQEPYGQRLRLQALGQSHRTRSISTRNKQHVFWLERVHQSVEWLDEQRQRPSSKLLCERAFHLFKSSSPLLPIASVLQSVHEVVQGFVVVGTNAQSRVVPATNVVKQNKDVVVNKCECMTKGCGVWRCWWSDVVGVRRQEKNNEMTHHSLLDGL